MIAAADLDDKDLAQVQRHGLAPREALRQLELLKAPPPSAVLDRPCTLGDGVHSLPAAERAKCVALFEKAQAEGRVMKFVPASGAGSRMFKAWLALPPEDLNKRALERLAREGDGNAGEVLEGLRRLEKFPFHSELKAAAKKRGLNVDALAKKGEYAPIVDFLLSPRGLNFTVLAKGLIPCHRYRSKSRTALEEHLVEAAGYLRDKAGTCRLHFTVAEDQLPRFRAFVDKARAAHERAWKARFDIGFSVQKKSTDTLAVDSGDRPFRRDDGSLLFRPGGHGALLENLNDLKADIVFIKNIDNVVPDRRKDETALWKKALGGLLIELQDEISRCLSWLEARPHDDYALDQAFHLLLRRLSVSVPSGGRQSSRAERRRFLLEKLNRPLRVCGVVENSGEPGGGPFWVKDKAGRMSVQIVEQAQVKQNSFEQQDIFSSATHFNPVDIVCAVRDRSGRPFDLRKYRDADAVFISRKSEAGRDLKALEHPGLWNGGMADWNTVFVEVPVETFNPIKTLSDLLRDSHQT